MDRRTAIGNIALASVSTLFITSCADQPTTDFFVEGVFKPNEKHRAYLAKISNAILPLDMISDRVGNPVDFVLAMMNDCRDKKNLNKFINGFESYKLLMKENRTKLKKASSTQILQTIKAQLEAQPAAEDMIYFVNEVRELSIQHLKSSEYYLTEFQEYKLVPEPYQACTSV